MFSTSKFTEIQAPKYGVTLTSPPLYRPLPCLSLHAYCLNLFQNFFTFHLFVNLTKREFLTINQQNRRAPKFTELIINISVLNSFLQYQNVPSITPHNQDPKHFN